MKDYSKKMGISRDKLFVDTKTIMIDMKDIAILCAKIADNKKQKILKSSTCKN